MIGKIGGEYYAEMAKNFLDLKNDALFQLGKIRL